jgi:Helicase conserved C-terminal domain/PLD-like domain/SNF2-related domain
MSQPEFVDNRAGNTLALALKERIAWLALTQKELPALAVATGYFNPEGFASLADELNRLGHVRLLLGAEPTPPPARPHRKLGEPRGVRFERMLTRAALDQNQAGLLRDRDLLTFDSQTDHAIQRLLEFLKSGQMEVRRYEERFLHGKAFLFSNRNGVIAGSSNFTAAGLHSNLELNLGHYQPSVVQQVERWFEDLWGEAVDYDLASLYQARYLEYSPYLIYLRVLWEKYGAELEEEATETGRIHLTRFQTDGLFRARRIIERYNGVLIADGVGLGKTFLAGEMLRDVLERNRQRALLIAPAALRDGAWERFKSRYQLFAETVSFEQLAADEQLGGDRRVLKEPVQAYSLIVVDEAHAFRSLDTRRSEALRRLLRGDPPKKLVLMTATPVNNSLWDLYDLLTYFVGHDSVFADIGIPNLKRRFDMAAQEDPFTLKPDVLFDVLDATTVRRTRHFVQRYYKHETIDRGDGTRITIQFPTPHVKTATYDFDTVLPGFFEEFADLLAPEDGEPALTMARYAPTAYQRAAGIVAREAALVGLIRSGLLKRFESSARAFERTTARMIAAHDVFLKGLAEGRLLSGEVLDEILEGDPGSWEDLLADQPEVDEATLDLPKLRRTVMADREIFRRLNDRVASVKAKDDPKLALLLDELAGIAAESERAGITPKEQRDRRKVLIFSYYADTVDWIVEYLHGKLETDRRLAVYRGRIAAVRGAESWTGITRDDAVFGFAPDSTDAPANRNDDRFDILVTTDVLAEGMNLQQAARIINYDLPWNPMRLVQRHGRIDRIGSPHRDVFITCIMPDRALERLLTLEARIRRKLAQAAASIGVDTAVLPGMKISEHYFADTLDELKKLRGGDAALFETAGEATHAHSGEEYRQELRKGLERFGTEIRALPGGAGSGLRWGTETGHFFCARIEDKAFLRFVPGDPAAPVIRDSLSCLARITCSEETQRQLSDEMRQAAYDAWARARADIFADWQRGADPANLVPSIRPLFRTAGAHVRQYPAEEMSLEEVDRLVEALEAPRGMRVEHLLRKVFTPETAEGPATTRRIAALVKELGLQPWKAPEPLPPIDEAEIRLVVWMGVEKQNGGTQ